MIQFSLSLFEGSTTEAEIRAVAIKSLNALFSENYFKGFKKYPILVSLNFKLLIL
ncbi:hypothetical protein ACEUDB_04755 [Aeromonas hydrophila]|uniref:hypothetical protein n=1 Tax=Aeromonas TaxID=642 RepID=UPI0038D1ED8E